MAASSPASLICKRVVVACQQVMRSTGWYGIVWHVLQVRCLLRRETAKEIASALAYLHSLNILHGDLSGGNILLTSSNKDPRKFTCKVRTGNKLSASFSASNAHPSASSVRGTHP